MRQPTQEQALHVVQDALWILEGRLAHKREDLDDILAAEISRLAFRHVPPGTKDPFAWVCSLESRAFALVGETLMRCGGSYAAAFLLLEDASARPEKG